MSKTEPELPPKWSKPNINLVEFCYNSDGLFERSQRMPLLEEYLDIPIEDYNLPQYAYLLERDYGTYRKNKLVGDWVVHGVPYGIEELLSPSVLIDLQIVRAEEAEREEKAKRLLCSCDT